MNHTTWLRRYSTGSLTIYIYSLVQGMLIRAFLINFDFALLPQSSLQFMFLEILGVALQLVFLKALDVGDWVMTPDWAVMALKTRFSGAPVMGFAARSHLAVRPVCLFGRQSLPMDRNDVNI